MQPPNLWCVGRIFDRHIWHPIPLPVRRRRARRANKLRRGRRAAHSVAHRRSGGQLWKFRQKRRANLRVTVVMACRFVTSWDRRLPHSPSPPCHPQDRDRRRYEAEIEKLEGKTRGALCSKTCPGNRAGRLRISRGNGKKPEEETHTCVRRAGGA